MKTIIVATLFLINFAHAQSYNFFSPNDKYIEKSSAPYFYTGEDSKDLPLLDSATNITIDGVIADIRVKQTYRNDEDKPLEAIYTFPASNYAAVYGLTIKIEDRTIEAIVQEKKKARETYKKAKQEGKSAALLEQDKPNLFTMNVANILPGETIDVELRYTELVRTENNIYTLSYPTTIDRNNPNATGYSLDPAINIQLNTPIPVHTIESPSHQIESIPYSPTMVKIKVNQDSSEYGGDFILRYQLAGKNIETGIQLSESLEENYFLLQIEPPTRIESSMIPNREYIFVVDVSGSMSGFPIETSKDLIIKLLKQLNEWEKFNVVFFEAGANVLSLESLEATPDNIDRLTKMLSELDGKGGTDLIGALKRAAEIPRADGYARSIVTITDGFISVESDVFKIIDAQLEDTNYFSFGIGKSVNRHTIDVIARAGYGDSYVVSNLKEANRFGTNLINTIRYPLLTEIDISFGDFEVYDIEPMYIPALYANKPITITGKWRGTPSGKIEIKGNNGSGEWNKIIDVSNATKSESRALEYIWARKEIQQLQDFVYLDDPDESLKSKITALGIKHNLLTNYTSFVAVDDIVRTTQSENYSLSNGFAIPTLLVNLTGASVINKQDSSKMIKLVGKVNFIYINNEWVDKRHKANIPIIEIPYGGEIYKKLILHYPAFSEFRIDEAFYINLGEMTIKVTKSSSVNSKKIKNIIIEAIDNHDFY